MFIFYKEILFSHQSPLKAAMYIHVYLFIGSIELITTKIKTMIFLFILKVSGKDKLFPFVVLN